jgi:hypothetical protein
MSLRKLENNLENKDCFVIRDTATLLEASVETARKLIDELPDELDELAYALDEAQGEVHMGNSDVAYIVIRITN